MVALMGGTTAESLQEEQKSEVKPTLCRKASGQAGAYKELCANWPSASRPPDGGCKQDPPWLPLGEQKGS